MPPPFRDDPETGDRQAVFDLSTKERTVNRPETQNEKEGIATVIRNSIAWALTKDVEMQKATMAQDEDLFYYWIASAYTISGWEAHEKLFDTWMDPRFKAVRTEVRDLRITLSRSGDVAWFSAVLDDVTEWDGQVSSYGEGLHWTGVLERRDGRWVIVQMHASLPVEKVREIVTKEMEAAG